MGKKHSRRIDHDDPQRLGKQAVQMLELIRLLRSEMQAMEAFTKLVDALIRTHFAEHKKLARTIKRLEQKRKMDVRDLWLIEVEYRNYLDRFEHQFGCVETPSIAGILNYSISLEDLLELFPIERVVEDFLDG